jgi:PAS domain S-box-containing protein
MKNKNKKRPLIFRESLAISCIYFVLGIAWILFLDDILGMLHMNKQTYMQIETYKGMAFVLITSVFLLLLVNARVKRLKIHQQNLNIEVKERTAELEKTVLHLKETEEQKDAMLESMRRQLQFEKLIFVLAQDFMNADIDSIDRELDMALRRIREYTGEDRICYIRYDWAAQRFSLKTQQNRAGIPPLEHNWEESSFKNAKELIEAHMLGRNHYIADTKANSSKMAEFLKADGIRSAITIPVMSKGKPRGFIGLYSLERVKRWEPFALSVMTIFAAMIKNGYERIDRNAAIKTSYAQMRVILNSTRDAICLMDPDGNIGISNNAFAKLYNISPDEITGKNIKDIVPRERYSSSENLFKQVMQTGKPTVYQSQMGDRHYEGSVYPVYDNQDQVSGVATFISDITQRVNNEREIFRSHQMLEELLQNAPVGIYWKDLDGKYLGCNHIAAKNLGITPEELIGQTNRNYMEQDAAEKSTQHDRMIIESKTVCMNFLSIMTTKTGEKKLFKINKVPLFNEDGDVYALLGVAEDITEQHKKEKELIQAKQDAKAASRAKSDFLSHMSHEIRTPLNAIIGLTHVASESDDKEQIKDMLDKVNTSSKHLLSIVNDILDISRIEAGKLSVSSSEIDLIAVIEEAVGIVMQRADEKKQRLSLFIDEALPKYVLSDAIRLKQVLMNLLFNAVKFTPEGGEIALRAHVQKSQNSQVIVKFSVTDNGIGIDQDSVDKLFHPFEQADSTSTRMYEGTGLGLAISRSIVKLMGGEIGALGEQGKGSTFYFILPLKVADTEPPSIDVAFEDLNVLVVDDDEETCLYMNSLFSQFGVNAKWVLSGKDAVEAVNNAADKAYNVVFVDWHMPGMNGIETVREVRRICGPDTFVIMFSMFEWGEIEHQAKEVGVSMFLTKPIFPSRLFNALSQICKRPKAKTRTSKTNTQTLNGRKILVAEDIEINQYILNELLKNTGAVLTPAMDGRQALDIFKAQDGGFDAILMDIQMPVMDGLEATRQIRTSGVSGAESIPIIAMTANVFKEDIDRALMAGMDAHIGKPIDADILIDTFLRLIRDN